VHGILVQLPVPAHINQELIFKAIHPHKDVDGLGELNQGALAKIGHKAPLIACTPLGCLKILDYMKYDLQGKHVVVLGRSILVGKPVALLLLSRDATVTICHSKTKDLPTIVRQADVVVAAIGQPEFVKGSWLKPGAVVLDVGMNAVEDSSKKTGHRLVGDVDFKEAKKVAGAITPVPGGVGPMTVAMLLTNTLKAYHLQTSSSQTVKSKLDAEAEGSSKRQRTD